MIEALKSEITKRQTANDNKSGTTVGQLMEALNLKEEINPLLRQLYQEKFITVRDGINNRLIFLR